MSVAARINAERVVLFGWTRAILLQLAHPLIAAGVGDHSSFRGNAFTAVTRLHHTIRAMLSLTFGDEAARGAALDGIRAIHRRVHGHLPFQIGPFAAGTRYSAEDPALLLWVHATLLESIPLAYDALVAPLSPAERDAYCREAADTAIALGAVAADVPLNWNALRAYMDETSASGRIVVSGAAREVATAVLTPPLAPLIAPVAAANRLMAVGWLPSVVREQYDFEWNARRERRLHMAIAAIRGARRLMPDAVALWPEARRGHTRT